MLGKYADISKYINIVIANYHINPRRGKCFTIVIPVHVK